MDNIAKEQKIELSQENIKKALSILGIDSSELNLDNIEKSKEKDEKPSDELKKSDDTAENATDEKKEKDKKEDDDDKGENSEKKDSGDIGKKDEEKEVDEEKPKEDDDDMEKSLDKEKIAAQKQIAANLEKSIEDNIKTLATLNDAILGKLQKSLERVDKLDTGINEKIEKAFSDVDDKLEKAVVASDDKLEKSLTGSNERNDTLLKAIDQRLEKLENTPNVRKSITATSYLKKAADENGEKLDGEKQVLSVSRDRQAISDLLLQKSGLDSGNLNKAYSDAVLKFEASKTLSKGIMDDLSRNEGIRFTS